MSSCLILISIGILGFVLISVCHKNSDPFDFVVITLTFKQFECLVDL